MYFNNLAIPKTCRFQIFLPSTLSFRYNNELGSLQTNQNWNWKKKVFLSCLVLSSLLGETDFISIFAYYCKFCQNLSLRLLFLALNIYFLSLIDMNSFFIYFGFFSYELRNL